MTKKITSNRLYNIALYYLSRYDASTGKVRQMLKRRLMQAQMKLEEIPTEAPQWIEDIIGRLVDLGYINDKRYGENQVRQLSEVGKSTRFIVMKLNQAGLDADLIETLVSNTESNDLERAKKIVRKKKLGIYRPEDMRLDYYKKDLATLARAGFSYETAVSALKDETNT